MTGDLGVVVADELFVFGRTKEVIIVNGKNLFAGDIESVIGNVAGVKPGRVAAFGIESLVTGSEELVIIAERDTLAGCSTAIVVSEISQIISSQFLISPKDVVLTDERWMVKSTSGKVSRSDNKAKYLATMVAIDEHRGGSSE